MCDCCGKAMWRSEAGSGAVHSSGLSQESKCGDISILMQLSPMNSLFASFTQTSDRSR